MLVGNIGPLRYMMSIAPYFSECIRELERLPVFVSKVDYEKAVEDAQVFERSQVLPLEGSYGLIQQETFYRLVQQKRITPTEFEAYRDYMDRYGKTKTELIEQKTGEITKSLETYQKRKARTGGDAMLPQYLQPYAGLNTTEMAGKIEEIYDSDLQIPTDSENAQWVRTLQEIQTRINKALSEGMLKEKDTGIEAGSYYDWSGRYQKFAGEEGSEGRSWHPLHEDCMEIGWSDGKVVSSVMAKVGDWKQVGAVTVHNKPSIGSSDNLLSRGRLENAIESLLLLLPFSEGEMRFDTEQRTIKFRHESQEKMLRDFAIKTQDLLQKISNNVELIHSIENAYFDGGTIVVPGKKDGLLTLEVLTEEAERIAKEHNDLLRQVIIDYNRLCFGIWDYQLENKDAFLLNAKPITDEIWIEKRWIR